MLDVNKSLCILQKMSGYSLYAPHVPHAPYTPYTHGKNKALLVLANGYYFQARYFGYPKQSFGEICFNTSMTGYQEILTDPSYTQQILCFSYPMIGNYGTCDLANEAPMKTMQAAGLIVRDYVERPSNHSSQASLAQFLIEQQRIGLEGIDTRLLISILREEGTQNAGIFLRDAYDPKMLEEVRALPSMQGLDLASKAGCTSAYKYGEHRNKPFRLGVLDFGIRNSALRLLDEAGFAVHVFPAKTQFEELASANLDACLLSSGPGDPATLRYAVHTATALLKQLKKPLFGICLGHQILGLACGAKSFKLRFGHRGANQPVRNEASGKVEITSQNHGFVVQASQSQDTDSELKASHINLNDGTIEAFIDEKRYIMSVQYHPEASPGPHDSRYLFENFFRMTENYYAR